MVNNQHELMLERKHSNLEENPVSVKRFKETKGSEISPQQKQIESKDDRQTDVKNKLDELGLGRRKK